MIYNAIGANPAAEMRWPAYLRGVLAFSAVSVLFLYLMQRVQGSLPGSLGFSSIDPDQAFNTRYSLFLSGATNRSGDDEELIQWVADAKAAVVEDSSTPTYRVKPADVPADAVTSSGSGLDPDISPAYAELQVHRVAERNNLDVREVEDLVADHTTGRLLGFMGEPRVNVLELNTALRDLTQR